MRLDYYQQRGTRRGALWKELGEGLDTAEQVVFEPGGRMLLAHRSYKNGNGLSPEELGALAARFPGDPEKRGLLRLSWFVMDPHAYARDVLDAGAAARFAEEANALLEARKVRRPLARLDGKAAALLEEDQRFLERHLRQFWWAKGDAKAPSRIVILHAHDCAADRPRTELTGTSCPRERVPAVLAVAELDGGVDLAHLGPVLDGAWRRYMETRPSNADNLTFAKDQIDRFKTVDETIRELARERRLLAPGGRKLLD